MNRKTDENNSKQFNFTKKGIEVLDPPQRKIESDGKSIETWIDYQDTQNHFLKLRVRSSGRKTFYYVRKVSRKVNWIKLDAFPEMTVFQARQRCNELSGEIAMGINPNEEKRKEREGMTLEELFNIFLEIHAKPHKKSAWLDELNFKNHLSALKHKRIKDLTPEIISNLHNQIGKKTGFTQANRVLALVKTILNFAIKARYLEGLNPGYGVAMFKEESRDRFLDASEMQRFFEALESEPNQNVKDFFMLALFTGARRGNLQAMKWANLDLERGIWFIPSDESKNSEPMKVILTQESIEILERRKKFIISLYVFPSSSKTGHLTEPKRAWKSLLKRAGIEDLRIHDLRRTLGSWQAAAGASLPIIGKSLGHKNQSTTAIYARLNLDPVRISVNLAVRAMKDAILKNKNNEKS